MAVNSYSRVKLILAFFAIYFVWGTTYLANLYALKALSPFVISALRYLIASLLLATLAYGRSQPLPSRQTCYQLAISGILMLVGGSGLVVVAEQYISSGATAVLVATEPLWFVLLDQPRWKQYTGNKKLAVGLLTGFAGIVLFAHFSPASSPQVAQANNQGLGIAIVVAATILWVIGSLLAARRLKPASFTLWHTTIQLVAAGLFAGFIALLDGEWATFVPQAVPLPAWGGLAFLILFGSLIAYLAYAWLITVQPPALVSTHTYINPLVAVLLGWLVAGEQITGGQTVALVVVLGGVALTQFSQARVNE